MKSKIDQEMTQYTSWITQVILTSILGIFTALFIQLSFSEKPYMQVKLQPGVILPDSLLRDGSRIDGITSEVTVFSDYRCVYCDRLLENFDSLKISYNIRNLPLTNLSEKQALSVWCVSEQGLDSEWAHRLQTQNKSEDPILPYRSKSQINIPTLLHCMSSTEARTNLELDIVAANYLNIRGTPAWIYDNRLIIGYRSVEEIRNIVF